LRRLTIETGIHGRRQAISPLLDRAAPGLVHLILSSSIQATPLASLSRPVAGTIGSTLVVTLPGSPKAVKENITALLSSGVITHALDLVKGGSGKAVHKALGVPDRLSLLIPVL
jgi:gephyrin